MFRAWRLPSERTNLFFRCLARQWRGLLKHIDKLRLPIDRNMSHDKMRRQSDALDFQPQSLAQFHIQQRQCNRQPLAVVDHAAEIAVGPMVVISATAVKAVVMEKIL